MLSRAKTLDGKTVEGYYRKDEDSHFIEFREYFEDYNVWSHFEIDSSTLEYKVNGCFYAMTEIETAIQLMSTRTSTGNEDKMVAYMDKEQYGAYMDWSMQNGYR